MISIPVNYAIIVTNCAHERRGCIPHAVSTRGAGAGRSGWPLAFSDIARQPARISADYKGANHPDCRGCGQCFHTGSDAVTENIPQKGRAKDGCRADKLSLGQVVIPPIWTRTQTSSPNKFQQERQCFPPDS